jgi:hypothetical protein
LVLAAVLPAQNVFHGNGVPGAYVTNSPGVLGQQLVVGFGSPTAPLPIAIFGLSDGMGPVFVPGPHLGNIGLDLFSPAFQALTFGLDGSGNGTAVHAMPPGFPSPGDPPLFALVATFEASDISISKTVRIDWANANGWEQVQSLGEARQLHTATPLGIGPKDNVTEVVICGGTTGSFIVTAPMASAELYTPLTRAVTPLPDLTLARSGHQTIRLPDGRLLVMGGVIPGGAVTQTCEFFQPTMMAFTPAPPMAARRSAHAATLLDNGKVLVTGGVSNWQNAPFDFINVLNTAQDTAELFDPVTNTWSALPNMASKRLGHSQTKLLDGRVLIVSGIRGGYAGVHGGGQIPQYTETCEIFDPATNTFAPTAPLLHPQTAPLPSRPGRAFHGASGLPSGAVLITGGFNRKPETGLTNDETEAVDFCDVWQNGAWSVVASLPAPTAFHGQQPRGTGALVCGGFGNPLGALPGLASLWFHDGAAVTVLAEIGIDGGAGSPMPRGGHTFTPLYDGTFLVYGGGSWPTTSNDGWVYTGN